jgi:hypothetical protein
MKVISYKYSEQYDLRMKFKDHAIVSMFKIGSTPPLLAKLGKSSTCHTGRRQTKKEGRYS